MSIKQKVFGFIYYNVLGWTTRVTVPNYDKCIICSAPHTSNIDLFIGKLFMGAIGRESGFLMKSDWFFWPLGPIFRWMGGIPVYRNKKTAMTTHLAQVALQEKRFVVCITPEATRSLNTEWKKGFWYIAKGANIPIVLAGCDFGTKCTYMEKVIWPGDDIEADMRTIKLYFKEFKGRHPEKFSVGNV